MLTNQLSSLLVVGRAPKGLLSIGKFPSSSSCSMSYHPFAPLEPLCNGQPMSRSMRTLPRSNNLRVLETIKIITHKLLGISTGAISVSDSISLHSLHQLNKKDRMATATAMMNMNTSLTRKPFTSAITTPQLTNLSIISRPPQTLLAVSSSILSSLSEFSLLPQLRFASPSSRHSGSQLTKLQKYMAYQNYDRLLLIIFAGVQGSPAAERMQTWFKVRIQQPNYHYSQSVEQPQSLLATPPSTQLPGGQYDFAVISQTDQSDWPLNGLTGMSYGVTFVACIHHRLTGHTVVQVRLIFRFLQSDAFLAYVQRFNVIPPLLQHLIQLMLLLACTS